MAKQIIKETIVTDDLTGRAGENIREVNFSYNGVTYAIDLDSTNRSTMDGVLSLYIEAARVVKPTVRGKAKSKPRDRTRASDMRAWCKANFNGVGDRGRIPAAAVEAYHAAHAAHAA